MAPDQACVDLVNRERGLESSRLAGSTAGADKFRTLYPAVDWSRQLAYAEDIGLGSVNMSWCGSADRCFQGFVKNKRSEY